MAAQVRQGGKKALLDARKGVAKGGGKGCDFPQGGTRGILGRLGKDGCKTAAGTGAGNGDNASLHTYAGWHRSMLRWCTEARQGHQGGPGCEQ